MKSNSFGISIAGIGAFVPPFVVTNDDLTKLVDASDEWITTRTGIKSRHVVSGNETLGDLCIAAARDALASAGMEGAEIDLIIVAASTPDTIYPAMAAQVQHAIGAIRAAGFDMALACTGFVYGMTVASQFLRTGMYKTALIIGGDAHSRYTDWYDRNTCVLFGDGAGACILKADPETDNILTASLHLDGSKGYDLTLYTPAQNCPLVPPREPGKSTVYMNGREMFKFAVGLVPQSLKETLSGIDLTVNDLDYLVLHQANIRIMEAMSEKLGIPMEKLITNLHQYGNTSAASIPIALNEAVLTGKVQKGHLLGLCGFGAGAAWASTVVRWTLADHRLGKHGDTAISREVQRV